ncbi:hypothetical protein VCSRO140_3465 [Vibrio cholerae]|nr:hypothetical protein VCSRO140_3465 [Vibrio cholerae]
MRCQPLRRALANKVGLEKMKPIEKLKQALGVPKEQKTQRAVKYLVASNFYSDGNLFIERFDHLKNTDSMENRSFRAKAVVDLAMSLECSLKCLVISLSADQESPEDAYLKARNLGHKLQKLYNEVKSREQSDIVIPPLDSAVFTSLNKLGVGSRYGYEVWLLRFNSEAKDIFLGNDLISSTVEDPEWVHTLRNYAVLLNNLADQCCSHYLSKHAVLSGDYFKEYERELSAFLAKVS